MSAQTPAAATTAAPTRMTKPCAATANASASPFGTPLTIRIAAPAPACVAAPAGAIGSAADAADAQRKASASGNEPPIASALSRTNTATARSAHDTEMKNHACEDERAQAVCSCSQRPTFQRVMKPIRAIRGSEKTSAAAATPAAAISAKPACTPPECEAAAATDAIGASATGVSLGYTLRL